MAQMQLPEQLMLPFPRDLRPRRINQPAFNATRGIIQG